MRVDQALARLFPEHSRSRLQSWLKSGRITIDGDYWTQVLPGVVLMGVGMGFTVVPLDAAVARKIMPLRASLYEAGNITVYYRLDQKNRLLMGGRGPQRPISDTQPIQYLKDYAERLWPEIKGVAWTHGWNGQLAMTKDAATGEDRPLTVRKHSDRLLEVMLKFRYGDQLADRLRVKVEDTGLDADALLRMPSEERRALTELLAKYKSNRRDEEDDDE